MTNNKENKCEYPKDLVAYFSKKDGSVSSFSVSPNLGPARSSDGESPYGTYSGWSRFKFTAINSGTAATFNVPISDLEDIFFRTETSYKKELEAGITSSAPANDSPAYTVAMSSGSFKGRTPAQILSDPSTKDSLLKQRDWLAGNLGNERYRAMNQKQIDAINEAVRLLEAGQLETEESTAPMGSLILYNPGARPQLKTKRDDGKCRALSCEIKWMFGQNYPVEISISEFWCPVETKSNGTIRCKVSEMDKSTKVENHHKLSAKDWLNTIRAIKMHMAQFEQLNAQGIFEDARLTDEANRAKAKDSPKAEPSEDIYKITLIDTIKKNGEFYYANIRCSKGAEMVVFNSDSRKVLGDNWERVLAAPPDTSISCKGKIHGKQLLFLSPAI